MVGPSFRAVRAFCDRVTFIVSDYGSEHKIPDLPDFLPDFFQKIGVNIPAPIADIRQKFLFPQGLLLPGGITYSMVWYGGGCSPWIVLVKSY